MAENTYSPEELQQLLDISNSVIEQLEYFNENFSIKKDLVNTPPNIPMNDVEAALFVKEQEAVQAVYNEMLRLEGEPFIGWIKLLEDKKETIYLVTRDYTPSDYHPKEYPCVKFVNKQAPLAAELFKSKLEKEFNFRNVLRKILYRDRYLIPKLHNLTDALQNTIELNSRSISVESLRKILELNKVDFTKIDIVDEITERVKSILKEAEIIEGLRRRIIQNIQLRDQPILDPDQIDIYRTPLIKNLVISGSAGTGKTTVVLNRISLATKPENLKDEEKEGITKQGMELLSSRKENWILYTPTELLKNYLKEAFNKEGIPAPEGKIKVWHDERIELGRNVLKFLIIGEKGQFRITTRNIFIKKTNTEIELYANEFKNYYLKAIEEKFYQNLEQIKEFDKITSFPNRLSNIRKYYESLSETDVQKKIVNLIERLSSERGYFNEIRNKSNLEIDELIRKILKEKNDLIEQIIPLLKDSTFEEMEDNMETEISDQDEKDSNLNIQFNEEEKVKAYQQLANTLFLFSERKIKKQSILLKGINGKIIELLKEIISKYDDKIILIGTLRLTLRLTNQITSGYIRNFIQLMPNYYLQFRNKILRESSQEYFCTSELEKIKGKKYISEIETDIVIFNMLSNTWDYFNRNLKHLTERTNNDLLENVKSIYKNIVSVDESTDFSSITLGCMYYICNPLIKSFTVSGDPMQRVTLNGIKNWDEINYFKVQPEVKYLNKVYRQSNKLLKIAKKLYSEFIGVPKFESAFEANENEPAPLIYNNCNSQSFKDWITKRIVEIYNITEGKASIALFVADDSKIDSLADLISESLADNSLEVECCKQGKILSTNSKVRIFSIEYIKGLEFEAVFYINIDEIIQFHPELFDKYLYVGITRAGSFLGVTYKEEFPCQLNCIRDSFEEGDWSKFIKYS